MKTAIVPAQVTTIEDRITGSFTISQLLILMAGMGLATLIYLLVTPRYQFNPFKLIAIGTVIVVITPLAIRVHGKIVADWLIILTRFWQRPHRYIFTKNDPATRAVPLSETQAKPIELIATKVPKTHRELLSMPDRTRVDELLDNPALAVRFVVAEKGGIDVSLTPVKQ